MDYIDIYNRWLSSPNVSESDKEILRKMSQEEIKDAFFQDLQFGTAGLRGVLGPGTNKMNVYNVAKATIGFGLYLKQQIDEAEVKGVCISHDNRHMSREFTLLSADILKKMGFKVYFFDSLRPTPELSYAVRYVKASGGIMITASHNPGQYNGFKVYDEKGCQLVPSKVSVLIKILSTLPAEIDVEVPLAEHEGEIVTFDHKIDDDYCHEVELTQLRPNLNKKGFKVVYSPQHGTSYVNAMRVFKDCGYDIIPVKEQCTPDPDFSATRSPNPEVDAAWELSMEYIKKENADFAVMTDPDGDRCGLAYRTSKGGYDRFTGNQSGALLLDYILTARKEFGTLPENGVVYDTIVSSSLAREVAHASGLATESFLTGFKFIGDRIGYYEDLGHGPTFVFGYEESYGCLIAPFVRDKDGIQAILLYTEMACYYWNKGIPLDVAYEKLMEKHGYHLTSAEEIYFEGADGAATMKTLMGELHANPPKELNGIKVVEVQDYLSLKATRDDGTSKDIVNLPPSDVIKLVFEDKSTFAIRPSGTEPKVKFYIEAVSKEKIDLHEKNQKFYRCLLDYLDI